MPPVKKYKLRGVEITRAALVNRGAQEHAKVGVVKNDAGEVAPNLNSPQGERVKENQMDIEQLKKQHAEAIEALKKAHATELAAVREEVAKAAKLGQLTDAERAHFATLGASEQPVFLAKSAADRKADVESAVIYKSAAGRVYRRGQEELAELAKSHDATLTELAKAREERDQVTLRKRAEDEMGNFAIETEVAMDILSAVDLIKDEARRKKAKDALSGANEQLAEIYKAVGHTGVLNEDDNPEREDEESYTAVGGGGEFGKLIKAYMKKHNVEEWKAQAEIMKTAEGRRAFAEQNDPDEQH